MLLGGELVVARGRMNRPRDVREARLLELEGKFRLLDDDLARQKRIVKDLESDGHSSVGARTVLRLMEQEQAAIIEELGYSPRPN